MKQRERILNKIHKIGWLCASVKKKYNSVCSEEEKNKKAKYQCYWLLIAD